MGCHVIMGFGLGDDVSRMLAISYIVEHLCHLMQGQVGFLPYMRRGQVICDGYTKLVI